MRQAARFVFRLVALTSILTILFGISNRPAEEHCSGFLPLRLVDHILIHVL